MKSIQPLPPEVIAQIKSSTAIISLNGVISELMKNALDAGSTNIDIDVDYARGGCVLEDDGLGILPHEFGEDGGLGKIYHSSRLNSPTPTHGRRGTFLASLSAMSLLTVTSHHHLHRSHNTLSMHMSQVISRQMPAPSRQYLVSYSHGTRVTVTDLFGNMPVRVKQRSLVSEKHGGSAKEWDLLKREVVILLLAWPVSVTVVVREHGTSQKIVIRPGPIEPQMLDVDINKVRRILSHATLVASEERTSWVSVGASTPKLQIRGTIRLHPVATKHAQFVAFGIQPLTGVDGRSDLHDEINRLFQNSAFGNVEDATELSLAGKDYQAKDRRYDTHGITNKEMKGRKGVDRWPTFYINIRLLNDSSNSTMVEIDDIVDDKTNSFTDVINLLQTMINEFLTRYHFRPSATHSQRLQQGASNEPKNGIKGIQLEPSNKHIRSTKIQATSHRSHGKSDAKSHNSNSHNLSTSSLDPLGINVKLPSFQRSLSMTDSPFDAWSRIKSGNILQKSKTRNNLSPLIPRPSTAPLPSCYPSSTGTKQPSRTSATIPQIPRTRLISSDGKIIRKPFDDIALLQPRDKASISQSAMSQNSSLNIPSTLPGTHDLTSDNVVTWINPVTKVKSLVNQRTGLTVPAKANSVRTPDLDATTSRLSFLPQSFLGTPPIAREPSPWFDSFFKKWDNPTYKLTESLVPRVSHEGEAGMILHGHQHNCTQIDIDMAFKDFSTGINGRISKKALRDAEVVSQVDKKFILVKIPVGSGKGTSLVIIDQHAADERTRIEDLFREFCTALSPADHPNSRIHSTFVPKPLVFDITSKEISLFRIYMKHFAEWGIFYDLPSEIQRGPSNCLQKLIVKSLPPVIAERCKVDPRILIELLRTEAWKVHANPKSSTSHILPTAPDSKDLWLTKIHNCPQGILDMLNSRACRSAVMFNDELSLEQCGTLVKRLASCAFPFQCAHGRPSLVPLVDLGSMLGGGWTGDDADNGMLEGKLREWRKGRA